MRRLALVVAILAACGGDDDGGGSLTVDDLPGALASARCTALVRCGAISDVASCRGLDLDADFDPELAAAVNNGTVIFNQAEARLCLAVGDSCEAERLFDDNEHCDLMFEGTLASAACAINEQCVSGYCSITSCPDACCPGACVGDASPPQPRLGESCVPDGGDCIDSYCNAVSAQCEAYEATGQSCQGDSSCARGYCNGVCTELPGEGEPCVPDPDSEGSCDSIGLYCNVTTSVCTPWALDGDTCSATLECSPVYNCNGGTCELSFRLGDTCNPDRGCIDGSYCDVTTLRCTAPKADGASCDSSRECTGDCDFDTSTCVTEPICI